ncbi:MAG: CHAP domain-containing protein [Verrucomicrobiota bacterium]
MKWCIALFIFSLILGGIFFLITRLFPLAESIDSYKGVAVYPNGKNYIQSHGRHYSFTGYYYGQKWQCVEFIKRFFYLAKNHSMPNVWGHATDFFDPQIPHGEINPDRGMIQYQNGGNVAPEPDDLIVFQNLTHYGHVAIITEVTENTVSMIQQNVGKTTRVTLPLSLKEGTYWIGDENLQATGWLRVSLVPQAN